MANNIENYIRRLLDASPSGTILLQRKTLAELFVCVPSQINYVLSTRFTPNRGYLVESRRGGGGYLRIRRLDLTRERVVQLLESLRSLDTGRQGVSPQEAVHFIDRLIESKIITQREGHLMKAALCRRIEQVEDMNFCGLRAVMLAGMLEALLHDA
jgi:transcriptional regulator CtsR